MQAPPASWKEWLAAPGNAAELTLLGLVVLEDELDVDLPAALAEVSAI